MKTIALPIPDARVAKLWLAKAIGCLAVLWVAYVVREIWVPLGMAFLLAMVLDPVVDRMEHRGWSRNAATIFIFGSFVLLAGGMTILVEPYLANQVSTVQTQFLKFFPDTTHKGLVASFHRMHVPDWMATTGIRAFEGAEAGFQKSSSWFTDYGMRFISNLIWVAIVPIVAFYSLRDFHLILGKALLLVPSQKRQSVQAAVTEITSIFAKYLRGLMLVSVLNGASTFLLLAALRVPSALLLGIIAGILYAVPYIGAMMTIVLTAIVAFVGGGPHAVLVAVGASIVLHQIVFDQVISPRILGGHVGLHPILSIIALLSGNLLLGIIGMILAVPVAACIQIAVVAMQPKLGQEVPASLPSDLSELDEGAVDKETQFPDPLIAT